MWAAPTSPSRRSSWARRVSQCFVWLVCDWGRGDDGGRWKWHVLIVCMCPPVVFPLLLFLLHLLTCPSDGFSFRFTLRTSLITPIHSPPTDAQQRAVLSDFDYSFSENGLVAYKHGQPIGSTSINDHLGEENIKVLMNVLVCAFTYGLDVGGGEANDARVGLECVWGGDRWSCVCVCVCMKMGRRWGGTATTDTCMCACTCDACGWSLKSGGWDGAGRPVCVPTRAYVHRWMTETCH